MKGRLLLFIIGLLFILPIYNLKPVIAVESEISGKGSAIQNESNPNVKYPIEGNQNVQFIKI